MSKYIVDTDDFEPIFKVDSIGVFGIGKSVTDNTEDHSWSRIKSIEAFEELNSYYINEHFSELQDTAYKKGLHDGESKCRYCNEYQRGLDDAWEAARKLFSSMADSDIEKAFPTEWNNGGFNALINLQPQEAIEKLKAYEEKQKADDEIKVGDEVIYNEHRFIVFATETKEHYASLFDVNGRHASVSQRECKKTGRHFDIDRILEEMRT